MCPAMPPLRRSLPLDCRMTTRTKGIIHADDNSKRQPVKVARLDTRYADVSERRSITAPFDTGSVSSMTPQSGRISPDHANTPVRLHVSPPDLLQCGTTFFAQGRHQL